MYNIRIYRYASQTNMEINKKKVCPLPERRCRGWWPPPGRTPRTCTVQYSTVHYSTVHPAPVLQRDVGLVVAGDHRPHDRVVPAQLVQQHLRLALPALQLLADLQIFLQYIFPWVDFTPTSGSVMSGSPRQWQVLACSSSVRHTGHTKSSGIS